MEEVGVGEGRGPLQGVNPDCPNAANPFHRCAEYCPVPPPRVAAKSPPLPPPPGRAKAVLNGTANGDRAERVITAAADSEEVGERRTARTPPRNEEARGGGQEWRAVNPDCPNAENPFHRCAEYCPVPPPRVAAKSSPLPPPPGRGKAVINGTSNGDRAERVIAAAADSEEISETIVEEDVGDRRSARTPPRNEEVGGGEQWRAVNPDCPNADNPFHRCAEYCPVPPPRVAAKSPPPPPPAAGRGKAVLNGTANGDRAERVITSAADSEEVGDIIVESEDVNERRKSPRTPPRNEEAGTGREGEQWRAVNPNCPNAENPFHRCAEYCPVPVPKCPAKMPPLSPGHHGRVHSDGELHPRTRRRDKGGGSGGLPLYVFLREGVDGEGKKVDPRCPNAPNPFHVCTDHCLTKMAEAGRSSEGAKSPLSIFSLHSRRSSSSSEEGSVKSGSSRKADPKCPNAANPFHECGEYCAAKMQQVEQQKGINMKLPRKKGGKEALIPNWKVDPRCPNASNPFHICAQYCFDHLNEASQTNATKSDKKKGKAISKEPHRGEINPDCANASNPYHQCGEYCKRKGDR